MQVNRIEDQSHEAVRAVIINVGTELVTTLALASAIEHCSIPILLINCDPTAESRSHFSKLMDEWDFDVLEAPGRTHGRTLDRLFRKIKADSVLLLDSDAEIRDRAVIERMLSDLQHPSVFGAGFVHGAGWLGEGSGCGRDVVLYEERPWLPCALFRTDDMQKALAAGVSFEMRVIHNDFAFSKALSQQLAKRLQATGFTPPSKTIQRLPEDIKHRLRSSALPWLRWARREFHGLRPNVVYMDTGADIYQWCKYHGRRRFAGPPLELLEDRIVHYQGVTRRHLYGDRAPKSTIAGAHFALSDIESEVLSRLRTEYNFTGFIPRTKVSASTI
jgi:hypothetical protein